MYYSVFIKYIHLYSIPIKYYKKYFTLGYDSGGGGGGDT